MCAFMNPLAMKVILNALAAHTATPFSVIGIMSGVAFVKILREYLDGKRIIINGQVTKHVYIETTVRIYETLMNLDL